MTATGDCEATFDVPLVEVSSKHFPEAKSVSDTTASEVNRKTAGLKPSSRRRYHAVLAAALNQAVNWGWIDVNPAKRSNAPKLRETPLTRPTDAEVAALTAAVPGEVWKMAIRLGVVTGFRRGEVCGLRWSDITDEHIYVRRSIYRHDGESHAKTTKSGRERRIPIDPRVTHFLAAWRAWCDRRAEGVLMALGPDAYVLSSWPDC